MNPTQEHESGYMQDVNRDLEKNNPAKKRSTAFSRTKSEAIGATITLKATANKVRMLHACEGYYSVSHQVPMPFGPFRSLHKFDLR